MAFVNNILDEANYKLKTEPLNLANIVSNFYDSSTNRNYEINNPIIFKKYYNILMNNVEEMSFDSRFKYKPEYVAYQIYGTSSYDYIILYANNMKSKKEFKYENFKYGKIKYFSKEIIQTIANDMSNKSKEDTIEIVSENYLLYNI